MAYNILIIDDSVVVRKMLIKTFGMSHLEIGNVLEAGNGQEGLALLEKDWVDLIFLDINMPVMNGMEFMERIKADKVLSTIPVIVVSTEGSQERRDELKTAGVKGYLRKPVTPESLVEAVEQVLGGQSHG